VAFAFAKLHFELSQELSRTAMNDWKIERRNAKCAVCARAFDEAERHFSALALRGEQLTREDRCVACWKSSSASEWLFWWRARHSSEKRGGVQLNLEALEQLFLRLEGKTELKLRELRYVLCLILLRKRRLKVRQIVREADGESFIVQRPRQVEALAVFVFDFTPERIDELRAELQHIFDGADAESALDTHAPAAGAEHGDDSEAVAFRSGVEGALG
jgi:hypothetical protein